MERFYAWINQQHQNIRFTKEEEKNGMLAFLDVLVRRESDGSLQTSVYRKPTFSGLYLKWSSFVPKTFKRGLVNCLLYRAWKICSSYALFHQEVAYIRQILLANGYPGTFLDSCINKFVTTKLEQRTSNCSLCMDLTRKELWFHCRFVEFTVLN